MLHSASTPPPPSERAVHEPGMAVWQHDHGVGMQLMCWQKGPFRSFPCHVIFPDSGHPLSPYTFVTLLKIGKISA